MPLDYIILDGDQIQITVTPPMLAPSLAAPLPLTASGFSTVNGKKVCIVGDELPTSLQNQTPVPYTTGGFSIPGTISVALTLQPPNQTQTNDWRAIGAASIAPASADPSSPPPPVSPLAPASWSAGPPPSGVGTGAEASFAEAAASLVSCPAAPASPAAPDDELHPTANFATIARVTSGRSFLERRMDSRPDPSRRESRARDVPRRLRPVRTVRVVLYGPGARHDNLRCAAIPPARACSW